MPTSDDFETLRSTLRGLISRIEALEVKFSTPAEEAAIARPPASAAAAESHEEPTGRRR